VCARPANKIGEYAELGAVTAEQLDQEEEEFLVVVKARAEAAEGKVNSSSFSLPFYVSFSIFNFASSFLLTRSTTWTCTRRSYRSSARS
jgi:hypothetical protein